MSTHLTADDVRAKNIAAMGAPLGALYTDLLNEVSWLHVVWHQYRVLFGTTPERIELQNETAGAFFGLLNDTLWESVLLHISRLVDERVVHYRDTLTLLRLPDLIQERELAVRVRSLIDQARVSTRFARDWRNRRIAHRELALVRSEGARPLEHASRASVEAVLALFRDIVNAFESHYFDSEMMFDFVSPPGDAEALLYQLRLARMIQEERHARLTAGEFREEDFRQPPEI